MNECWLGHFACFVSSFLRRINGSAQDVCASVCEFTRPCPKSKETCTCRAFIFNSFGIPLSLCQMAHRVGVTYEPEIFEFDLDPRSDVMLVLASDGVWDVMSAEDIRKVQPPPFPHPFHSIPQFPQLLSPTTRLFAITTPVFRIVMVFGGRLVCRHI